MRRRHRKPTAAIAAVGLRLSTRINHGNTW
jgi:hypothetical protein